MKTPREIKAALALMGIRQADIARDLGVSPQIVCAVIGGTKKSAKVSDALEKILGKEAA